MHYCPECATIATGAMKESLAQTDPYLRSPEARLRMIVQSCVESAAFEGAENLDTSKHQVSPPAARASESRKKSRKAS